jgi:hypothetical protein
VAIVMSHGIEFVREGECRQCGACGCKKECPHYEAEDTGLFWVSRCTIYHRRDEFCVECGTDHASCIGYPDNPWIGVVRTGACVYKFTRVDGGSMDDLPFLYGQPYRVTNGG